MKQEHPQGSVAMQSVGRDLDSTARLEDLEGTIKDASSETTPDQPNGEPKDISADIGELGSSGHIVSSHNDPILCQNSETSVQREDQQGQTAIDGYLHKGPEGISSNRPAANTLHFYLHAPRLPSPQPVLIPLSSNSTLSECLRNSLVLEFPSIYALQQPSSELPDRFITEDDFGKKMQQEDFQASILAKLTGNEEGEIEEQSKRDEDVDAKKLEEVLIRDLRQFKGEP